MKISLKWLSEYVEVPNNLQEFCDKLDLTGTGVEGVEISGAALEGVVVGYVETCEPHPDSDHMHVARVQVAAAGMCGADSAGAEAGAGNPEASAGENAAGTSAEGAGENFATEAPEPLQIVCGAPNIKAGIKVAVATIGTVMPEGFKIKKSKLRGVASCGMCCSKRELGLGTDHEGIMILPEDAPVGTPLADYLKLTDTILDLEITPNRPDCLSYKGFAREVGAMYKLPVKYPTRALEPDTSQPNVQDLATIEIQDPARCARYTARVIKNVKIGPSPDWLAQRVQAAGARSINNIVDVTNYILFLLGQPLHAFDFDKLKSADGKAHITVRAAADGEKFTTLDGTCRTLTQDMTLISTPDAAVALAGVMGGLDSEVTDSTTTILLESAAFESGRTSRTSRNLSLISESSMRYERGVDDNTCEQYSAYAAALMAEVSGGVVCPGVIDVYPRRTEPYSLKLRVNRCNAMLGAQISADEMQDILERLGCVVSPAEEGDAAADTATSAAAAGDGSAATSAETVLNVTTPTFRPDLEREIDLYEEILRLYGMDRIKPTLPESRGRLGVRTQKERKMSKLNTALRACGLNETMTYSFANPEDIDTLRLPKEGIGQPVQLINPLNAEQSVMRQSILPGLLKSAAYNQSRGVKNIQLYETGVVFFAHEGKKKPKEREKLAGVMCGAMAHATWNSAPYAFDFFDGKGVVENLARELCIPKLRFRVPGTEKPTTPAAPHLQPGRGAYVYSASNALGWVGEIHPSVAAAFDVQPPVVAFELDIHALLAASADVRPYTDVPQFPAVELDLAFVVPEEVTNERMEQVITSAGGKLLEGVRLFDVYRDKLRVGDGKKSMAYKLTYRAADKTLKSEEVERVQNKIIKKACAATGAEVRA